MTYAHYALWAALAGAFIPVMAVLNARLGRSLGEPIHAAFVLFAVGLLATGATSLLLTGRLPTPRSLAAVPKVDLLGGFIVGFYVLSITMLAPRFGVGNAILFVMAAQLVTSACIDHVGFLGAAVRPLSLLRAVGRLLLLAGLAITQLATAKATGPAG